MNVDKKTPKALVVVTLIALIHGIIYVVLLPPWQHYDEPNHFEYAWLLANRARLPQPGDYDPSMRREVAQSMIEHEFYKGMGYLPDLDVEDGQVSISGYSQLDEPPAHYLLAAIPVWVLKNFSVTSQLYGARLVSVGLFVMSVAAVYGLTHELTNTGTPLRWIIPSGVAMLPGYAELMSAMNNDVGAAAFMTVMLWGVVRLVKKGWQPWTVVWSGFAMVLCLLTKETVYLAAPVWLLGVALSLVRRGWTRLVWIGVVIIGAGVGATMIGWGDALLWYRASDQAPGTRMANAEAPVGEAVFILQLEESSQGGGGILQLNQLIPGGTIRELRGKAVTVGAWMWADQPVSITMPVLTAIRIDGGANQAANTIEITTQPAFYAYLASVPDTTSSLRVQFGSNKGDGNLQNTLYVDGVVLAQGEYPLSEIPKWDSPRAETGTWGGIPVINLVRNGSAEVIGPRIYPWADQLGSQLIPDGGRLSLLLYSITDYTSSGYYFRSTADNMLKTFWGKFAWGHIQLEGKAVYDILKWVSLLGAVGCLGVFWQKLSQYQGSAIAVLGLSLLGVWGMAVARGAIYLFNWPFIPGARYAYPVIGPTLGILGYGWWSIMRLAGKLLRIKPTILVGGLGFAMLVLDMWSIISIWRYYAT